HGVPDGVAGEIAVAQTRLIEREYQRHRGRRPADQHVRPGRLHARYGALRRRCALSPAGLDPHAPRGLHVPPPSAAPLRGAPRRGTAPGGIARNLRVEADELWPLRDRGAASSLPAARLDDEEIGQGAVELVRIFSGDLHVLHFALLGKSPPATAEVLPELRV